MIRLAVYCSMLLALADPAATLLRPSEAPAQSTLLRPAANAPDTDPALLLRPSQNDSRDT